MAKNASRFDLSRVLIILGIPLIRPTLTTIEGYLYINAEGILKGIAYLPLKLRLAEIDSPLPSSVEVGRLPGPSLGTLFCVCIRSVLLPIMEPGVNPFICLRLAKHNLKAINRQIDRVSSLSDESPRLAMCKILASLEILVRLQIKNPWPYFDSQKYRSRLDTDFEYYWGHGHGGR